MIGWVGFVRASTVPVLMAVTWLTVGTVVMRGIDALPEHGPHVEYSATMPYSPRVGVVQSTMGVLTVGPLVGGDPCYGEV
jgi:hypothetical protein